jgi:hypothetical protein
MDHVARFVVTGDREEQAARRPSRQQGIGFGALGAHRRVVCMRVRRACVDVDAEPAVKAGTGRLSATHKGEGLRQGRSPEGSSAADRVTRVRLDAGSVATLPWPHTGVRFNACRSRRGWSQCPGRLRCSGMMATLQGHGLVLTS